MGSASVGSTARKRSAARRNRTNISASRPTDVSGPPFAAGSGSAPPWRARTRSRSLASWRDWWLSSWPDSAKLRNKRATGGRSSKLSP